MRSIPKVGLIVFTYVLFILQERYITLSKNDSRSGLFETLKMFYPPVGRYVEYLKGSDCFYLCFNCWIGKVHFTFKTFSLERSFWNLENVLSTEKRCVANLKWYQLFLLVFNCWLGKVHNTFKTYL